MMISKKVVVIGAGAAGLMAGATAALYGASVTIIEKNKRVGRKIMITGKGRCNLANNCDVQTFINNVPVNGRFLYSAINAFTPEDTIEFLNPKDLKQRPKGEIVCSPHPTNRLMLLIQCMIMPLNRVVKSCVIRQTLLFLRTVPL